MPAGEYYLKGVMETASGFNLHQNNTFEFFFSYGALDRHGYGTWSEGKKGTLVLNSDYNNQMPFEILAEKKENNSGLVITLPDYNKALQSETKIVVTYKETEEEQVVSSDGAFHFIAPFADKIVITCLYYIDNPATLFPSKEKNNYIELKPNHNLPLVHFIGAVYTINENTLKGKIHFMDEERIFDFEKHNN